MNIQTGQHILVLGRTGSGKSVFIRDNLLPYFKKYIIYDFQDMDKYHKKCNISVKTPQELEIALKTKINKIHYVAPTTQSENMAQKDFNEICRVTFERGRGYAFIVDELSHICDSYHIERYHRVLMVQGRKYGITHIGGTQRPSSLLHKIIYTQSRHKFIFRLDNHDIKVLEKYLGDAIEQTRDLPPYQVLYNSDFENKILRSVKTL